MKTTSLQQMKNFSIEDKLVELDKIEEEWDRHRTMSTCSICDSPKGHTLLKDFLKQTILELLTSLEMKEEPKEYDWTEKYETGYEDGYNGAVSKLNAKIKQMKEEITPKGEKGE